MIYREYGRTGVEVSALGMGCMRFERPDDVDDMAAICLRAYDGGVTYFDTAPGYCKSLSETILGRALGEMKRRGGATPIVATKTSQSEEADVRRDLETSLQRLGLDVIDFYHVWWVVRPEDLEARKAHGVLEHFQALKDEGLIRHISISAHLRGDEIEAMLADHPLFEGILLGFNAANFQTRQQGLEAAARRGLGVVTMNTLGGGLLPRVAQRFDHLRQPDDESVVEACLRFNLSYPGVTTALVGFSSVREVDEALAVMEDFVPLRSEEIEALKRRSVENMDDLCTNCGYCQPCPQGVPVARLMDAHNLWKLTGNAQQLAGHLKWHWGVTNLAETLALCDRCGQCEERCTQQLPIRERFEVLLREWRP